MKVVFAMAAPLVSLVVLLQSCTYDKEMLIPTRSCADTVNVSFAASIQPLLRASCFSCHGNGSSLGNVSLDSYDDVKALAASGRLLGSIWIDEGARNN